MELGGNEQIAQALPLVWAALNDPAVLRECITGCESIEKTSDTEYQLAMLAVVGPVKARFKGKLMLTDLQPPHSYAMTFEGSGGAAGFGKGTARVSLDAVDAGTELTYQVQVQVGGKLAQIGSRLIDGVARKLAADFFKAFNAKVGTPAVSSTPDLPDASADGDAPEPGTQPTGSSIAGYVRGLFKK